MRQPAILQRWFWRPPWPFPARGRAASALLDAGSEVRLELDPRFLAQLHPLHRRYVAYRRGLDGGRPHSLEETAAHFVIDAATARRTERYLLERYRVHLDRSGWRASQATAW